LWRIKKIDIHAPELMSDRVQYGNAGIVRSRTGINNSNGTSTLFAAPDISPATATALTYRRKRRFEFQGLSDRQCKQIPDMRGPDSGIEVYFSLDIFIIRYGLDKRLARHTKSNSFIQPDFRVPAQTCGRGLPQVHPQQHSHPQQT
jgi:hypothetical protein